MGKNSKNAGKAKPRARKHWRHIRRESASTGCMQHGDDAKDGKDRPKMCCQRTKTSSDNETIMERVGRGHGTAFKGCSKIKYCWPLQGQPFFSINRSSEGQLDQWTWIILKAL